MYSGGGYNANQNPANGSASQSAASNYNYDNLFGSSETNAYNAQQYQQYLNALSQYTQQSSTTGNAASMAAGYAASMSTMMDSYPGTTNFSNSATSAVQPPPPSDSTTQQFTSFEQAMMQQARINQPVNRPNPGGYSNFKQPFVKRNFGNKPNMQGAPGSFQKRKGPPKPPVDPEKYYCDICNISCANPQAFSDHNAGKSHKRKEELSKGGLQPLAKNKSSFKCEVCNVTCTGKESFDTHINGVKHAKAIKNLQLLGRPIPENISTVIPPSNPNPIVPKNVINSDGNGATPTAIDIGEESMQPIGEEFIEAIEGTGKQTQYKCKLCECTCGDATAKNLHIRGRRHRLNYKQKVDFSIHVDAKPNSRNVKARKQLREKEMKPTTFPPQWTVVPANAQVLYAIPDTTAYDLFDEQHCLAKLEQLRAEPKIVQETDALIELVEKALKKTSDLLTDKIMAAMNKKEDADPADDIEKNRVLRGVIRTGVLGDRLIIKSDRQITAALLCKEIPTVSLLQSITSMFIENIEDEELRKKTTVEALLDDSSFVVRFNDGEMTCTITLTSIALDSLDENGEAVDESATKVKIEKPKDSLPTQQMEVALSSIRQSKFFQSVCWPIQGLCEVVVLLRDLVSRQPDWNVLSLHALELLVYKAVITSPVLPRISDSFRRFFEAIAGGGPLGHTKLIDPCEKNEFDILGLVNAQKREAMMVSAQQIIRLIAFDQIYTVLGIERLPALNRKRPNNENDEENGIKKQKEESMIQ